MVRNFGMNSNDPVQDQTFSSEFKWSGPGTEILVRYFGRNSNKIQYKIGTYSQIRLLEPVEGRSGETNLSLIEIHNFF